MRRVELGRSGIEVSAIGYGCVGLTTLPRESDALRLLARAYDAGITHFDTARAYGAGFSEEILGQFAKGRRDRLTIATKFGLDPPPIPGRNRHVVRMAKRLLKSVPFLDRRVRSHFAAGVPATTFSPANCRASLERSLSALGTDHVDILFLHNGRLADAQAQDLAGEASRLVEAGKTRAIGVSAPAAHLSYDFDAFPDAYDVFQTETDMTAGRSPAVRNTKGRGLMVFAALAHLSKLQTALRDQAIEPSLRDIGIDAFDSNVLVRLLLSEALISNRNGGVLVGTTSMEHLVSNIRATEALPTESQQVAFRALCERILHPPPHVS